MQSGREALAILPIIATVVLQGFRSDVDFRRALGVLLRLALLEPGLATHVRAAQLFRSLRTRGVIPRRAVDCVVA